MGQPASNQRQPGPDPSPKPQNTRAPIESQLFTDMYPEPSPAILNCGWQEWNSLGHGDVVIPPFHEKHAGGTSLWEGALQSQVDLLKKES